MKIAALKKSIPKNGARILLFILYCPLSCFVVGMMAYFLRLRGPLAVDANYSFSEVFWYYALPFPGIYTGMHLFTLAFGLLFIGLLVLSAGREDGKGRIFQLRLLLLVLATVITIIIKIFIVTIPAGADWSFNGLKLFLFVDLDLVLLFLLTYLPIFRSKGLQTAV